MTKIWKCMYDFCCFSRRTDVDECLLGIHSCEQTVVCENQLGDYQCLCPAGTTGNGSICKGVQLVDLASHFTYLTCCWPLGSTCIVVICLWHVVACPFVCDVDNDGATAYIYYLHIQPSVTHGLLRVPSTLLCCQYPVDG